MRDNQATGRYTQIVTRTFHQGAFSPAGTMTLVGRLSRILVLLPLLSCAALFAQEEKQELPPEEDESFAAPREYAFNPVQAQKELKTARFYMKKGSHRAAALRAQEAIKWDDSLLEAYVLLGEAREKNTDPDGALKAYRQYLELTDEKDKERRNVQRRVDRLSRQMAKDSGTATGIKPQ